MTTPRKYGTGSVTERASGRFQARLILPSGRRQSLGTYKTPEEAEGILHGSIAQIANGTVAEVGGVTFRAFGANLLDQRERDDIRGIRTERYRWKLHIATAPWADESIATITPQDILSHAQALSQKRAADRRVRRLLSRQTVQRCMALVRVIFGEAIVAGHRADNPCAGLKLGRRLKKRSDDTEDKWDILNVKEQRALATCDGVPEWARLLMAFAIGTGLRQGEQWNLQLRDFHVEGVDPHVVVRFGSKGKLPKSGKVRRVPLFGLGLQAAKRWLAVLPKYAPKNPLRLVFPGPTGARRGIGAPCLSKKETTVENDVKRVKVTKVELLPVWLAAAGIKRKIRWHDFRHTCGSSLVAGWWGRRWSLEEVKEMLGHSDISVTQKYAHIVASALQQAARESGSNLVPGGGFGGSGIAAIFNEFTEVGRAGLEPATYGLKVRSSTN
jgi:integrase